MSLLEALHRRYTTKAYDPARPLPQDVVAQLLEALRLSPSSVNAQPWHFVVAASDAGKARIATATAEGYRYNTPKVLAASHVVVLCARTDLPEDYLQRLLDQEQADGRLADAKARQTQHDTRAFYVGLHREAGDVAAWAQKQTYLALGSLLLAAGLLGVDATPMEGFDVATLDAELGLRERGLSALVLVALGQRADSDFNAGLPKSRLPAEELFTIL